MRPGASLSAVALAAQVATDVGEGVILRGLYFRSTGSLDNLQVAELPMPVPKAGEVLVKVLAAAINPSDVKNVLGKMAETATPRVPGRDFAGRVISGDSRWEGKAVFGTGGNLGFGRDGSHAEFVAVPVEALVEMPPEFSNEQAAGIGLEYLTAFAALVRTGAVQNGETVLVTGTSPGHRDHGRRWVGCGKNCGLEGGPGAGNREVKSRPRQAKRPFYGGMDRPRGSSPAGSGEGIDRRKRS